uniref:BHLH domain-containing protein n=1 Tax=Schistocephalus solidus TaxID=70667 RepID=A0A183T3E4_SCHSO
LGTSIGRLMAMMSENKVMTTGNEVQFSVLPLSLGANEAYEDFIAKLSADNDIAQQTAELVMDASDDMDDMFVTPDVRARRRRLHTEAEQRRRDAIKVQSNPFNLRGFDNLLELIHPVKADPGSSLIRMSKATILNRCRGRLSSNLLLSYLIDLKIGKTEVTKTNGDRNFTEQSQSPTDSKFVRSILMNYERIALANSYAFDSSNSVVTEPTKIQLFQLFMESLFQSFDSSVSGSEMDQLSRQIITWMEISCKPESLRVIMETLIRRLLEGDDEYTQSHQAPSSTSSANCYPVADSAAQFDHSSRKSTGSLLSYKPFTAPQHQPQTPIFVLNHEQQGMFNTEMPNDNQSFDSKACVSCGPGSNFTPFAPASEMVYQRTGHTFNAPERHGNDPVQQDCGGTFFVMPPQNHERHLSGGSAPLIVPYQSQPTPTATKDISAEMGVKSLSETLSPSPSSSLRAGLSGDSSSRISGSLVVNSTLPSHFQTPFQPPRDDPPNEGFEHLLCRFNPPTTVAALPSVRNHQQQTRRSS